MQRVQLRRSKGWRMPPNTMKVDRSTTWGNPFVVGEPCGLFDGKDGRALGLRDEVEILIPSLSLEQALKLYSDVLRGFISPEMYPYGHELFARLRHRSPKTELAGKNLACWCPLDQACHADILLKYANER